MLTPGTLQKTKHRPLSTPGIWTNDDGVLPALDMVFDICDHERFGVQVVDGKIEEALDLAGVQIHGDNVVATGNSQHIGDELGGDGRAALVFFVHPRVGVARDDGGNAAGGSTLACGYEDKQLHQVVVDVATGRLENEDVLVADRLRDLDVDLPIRELRDRAWGEANAKPRWIVKSQSVDCFRAAQAKLQLTARPQPRRAPDGCCLARE